MRLRLPGSKEKMTRREFLRTIRPKKDWRVIIHKDKCTGCGLCMVDCPTQALSLSRGGKQEAYQFLFRPDRCDACGICERSCPENCLRLERESEGKSREKQAAILFEDEICRCTGCGIPLFPRAMVKKIEDKMMTAGKPTWSFDFCPSCRVKSQFEGERIEKSKA
jgi:ferredoxin